MNLEDRKVEDPKVNIMLEEMYQADALPTQLSNAYHMVSCLKYTDTKKVYIIEKNHTKERYILKCRTGTEAELLQTEYAVLTSVQSEFLPKAVSCFVEEGVTYLLRAYVEGETLEQQIERRGVYKPEEAISIMQKICDCVLVLHKQKPVLLHRDIKPQNILAAKDGTYKLIDLDTIREYKEDGDCDTVCMGTRETAAPEQFGFCQTSVRSDIYSMGILFLFLLTGAYTMECREWETLPRPIQKTIRKCLAFDPKKRYSSATALRRKLEHLECCFQKKKRRLCSGVLAAVIFVAGAGILLYSFMEKQHQIETIQFKNSQLEAAVRQSLSINENEPVYQSDLDTVTTLILCGDRCFQSWEEHETWHDNYFDEFNKEERRYEAADFSDLQYFTNLRTLAIDNQGLEDVSVLQGLPLERLSLRGNQITDLTGIETSTGLTMLIISANPLSDINALKDLQELRRLDISDTSVQSIDVLEGMALSSLNCSYNCVTDYSVLESMEALTTLQISHADSDTIAYINTRKNLVILGLFESSLTDLEEISDLQQLECIDIGGCRNVESLAGIEAFPKLNYLGIRDTGIHDISAISAMTKLEMLDIVGTDISDLSVIADCSNLRVVFIDSGKEARIQQLPIREEIEVIVSD